MRNRPTIIRLIERHASAISLVAWLAIICAGSLSISKPDVRADFVLKPDTEPFEQISKLHSLAEFSPLIEDLQNWARTENRKPSYLEEVQSAVGSIENLRAFALNAQLPMRYSSSEYGSTNYRITLPLRFSYENKSYPVVIDLHGIGLTGMGLEYSRVELEAPFSDIIFISPVCESYFGWNTRKLDDLLDHLQSILPIDAEQVSLMGHSLGGNAVWRWASESPSRFAAISPWSSWGGKHDAKRILGIPVRILHGARDSIVSPDKHLRVASVFLDLGGDIDIQIIKDRGHWIDEKLLRTDVIEWLVSHSRTTISRRQASHSTDTDQETRVL